MSSGSAARGRGPRRRLRAGRADRARREHPRRRRRDRRYPRTERRRQVDPDQVGRRTGAEILRPRPSRRRGRHRPSRRTRSIRHGLAFVPQTENVFAGMTVADNFALAAAILPHGERRTRIAEMYAFFPGPRRARRRSLRRPALGRRTADAGDRPRADGPAAAPGARRGLGRAFAEDGRDRLRPA